MMEKRRLELNIDLELLGRLHRAMTAMIMIASDLQTKGLSLREETEKALSESIAENLPKLTSEDLEWARDYVERNGLGRLAKQALNDDLPR
jgi:nitrate reductase cytochrome c-type subunit